MSFLTKGLMVFGKQGPQEENILSVKDGAIVWAGRCLFESSEGFTTTAWAVSALLCFPG